MAHALEWALCDYFAGKKSEAGSGEPVARAESLRGDGGRREGVGEGREVRRRLGQCNMGSAKSAATRSRRDVDASHARAPRVPQQLLSRSYVHHRGSNLSLPPSVLGIAFILQCSSHVDIIYSNVTRGER